MTVSSDDAGELLLIARALLEAMRDRDSRFGTGLFADPAWELLLNTYVLRTEGRESFVDTLERGASVPRSTVRRWIYSLVERNLLNIDQRDEAPSIVSLTPHAIGGLERHFRMIRDALGPKRRLH